MENKNDEHFNTIKGWEIRCDIDESEFKIEITINRIMYNIEKIEKIKRIFAEILFSIGLNYLIYTSSLFLPLNIIFFFWVFIELYLLFDLIEYGKNIIII